MTQIPAVLAVIGELTPKRPYYYVAAGIAIAIVIVSLLVSETAEIAVRQAVISSNGGGSSSVSVFPEEIEQWRPTVAAACKDTGLGLKWEDTVLAIMQAESGGDDTVASVVGSSEDVMQSSEGVAGINAGAKSVTNLGATGLVAWDVRPSIAVPANSSTASIYAGTLEVMQTVGAFEGWIGTINTNDTGKIGLIAQGYNYGYWGWSNYCESYDITTWTYDASLTYQSIHGGGTATHGQKVMDFYDAARNEDR